MSKLHSSRTRVASGLATLALLSGCQLAKMQVSPTLAGVEPWPVSRAFVHKPEDPLSFGAWRTSRIHVGWTRRTTTQPDPSDRSLDVQTLEKPFGVDLASDSGVTRADCRTQTEAITYQDWLLDSAAVQGIPRLRCDYTGVALGTFELFEMLAWKQAEAGRIEFGVTHWYVESVQQIVGARNAGGIVGYEIRRDGEVIAAVQIIHPGSVWMLPTLGQPDRDRAAAIVTTLLLYESPLAELEQAHSHDED